MIPPSVATRISKGPVCEAYSLSLEQARLDSIGRLRYDIKLPGLFIAGCFYYARVRSMRFGEATLLVVGVDLCTNDHHPFGDLRVLPPEEAESHLTNRIHIVHACVKA
jgi:hypothetical protein